MIRTNKPNVRVSWQVTARRNDAYMRAHPFNAEPAKKGAEQGKYVTPALYGKPASRAVDALPGGSQGKAVKAPGIAMTRRLK